MDDTADPITGDTAPRGAAAPRPVVEIAFHSDLRRIGDRAPLRDDTITLGRDAPAFGGTPLDDPCVSRRQVTIAWNQASGVFRVTGDAGARRPVRLFGPRAQPLGGDTAPPGSFVAIGDRVLLLLAVRSNEDGEGLGLHGHGDAIAAVRDRIRALAASRETVLVRGETGVGKELVAAALHDASPRAHGRFVPVNCAALPETLVESELFGHVRGAFSGANAPKDGLFRAAEGGTLFLDEIGELTLPVQAKLLRALQLRKVRPVGADNELPVDVRIVAATNRDLEREVQAGRFRGDLLARLEGLAVDVPALRDRIEDVPLLFSRFLRDHAAAMLPPHASLPPLWRAADTQRPPVSMDFFLGLLCHPWPRNVRELEKLAAAASALNRSTRVFVAPELVATTDPDGPPTAPPVLAQPAGQRPSEGAIVRALEAADHVAQRAAKQLGVSHSTLDRWQRELGIARPKDLSRADLERALERAGGDDAAAAKALRVSLRGLRLRLTELGISR
jgi:two-component system nitrogen regulation response regulator GlnG